MRDFDALGRLVKQEGPSGTMTAAYDLAGRRTRFAWAGYQVDYDRLATGEVEKIRENGATSGLGVLASFAYDDLGRRTGLVRGNGTSTSYGYDAASRLSSLVHTFPADPGKNLTLGFAYNPAGQIVEATRSNDLYAWTGHGSGTTASTANGLNQVDVHGGTQLTHDAKGNLTFDGTRTYGYTSENLLTTQSSGGSTTIRTYDPLGRLASSFATGMPMPSGYSWFGDELVGETFNGNVIARFVHGPGADEPLVSLSANGTRTWLHADERGSIVAGSLAAGTVQSIVAFDEYGRAGSASGYRFGFTGQMRLGGDLHFYKARMYYPALGRFLQPDPIGYGDGMNMYAYVGGDPVNAGDPDGATPQHIICKGTRLGCGAHRDRGGSGPSPGSSGASEYVGRVNMAAAGAQAASTSTTKVGSKFYPWGGRSPEREPLQ